LLLAEAQHLPAVQGLLVSTDVRRYFSGKIHWNCFSSGQRPQSL